MKRVNIWLGSAVLLIAVLVGVLLLSGDKGQSLDTERGQLVSKSKQTLKVDGKEVPLRDDLENMVVLVKPAEESGGQTLSEKYDLMLLCADHAQKKVSVLQISPNTVLNADGGAAAVDQKEGVLLLGDRLSAAGAQPIRQTAKETVGRLLYDVPISYACVAQADKVTDALRPYLEKVKVPLSGESGSVAASLLALRGLPGRELEGLINDVWYSLDTDMAKGRLINWLVKIRGYSVEPSSLPFSTEQVEINGVIGYYINRNTLVELALELFTLNAGGALK